MQALSFLSGILQDQNTKLNDEKESEIQGKIAVGGPTAKLVIDKDNLLGSKKSAQLQKSNVPESASTEPELGIRSSPNQAFKHDLFNEKKIKNSNSQEITVDGINLPKSVLQKSSVEDDEERKITTKIKVMSQTIIILNNTIANLRNLYHASRDLTKSRQDQIIAMKNELCESIVELEKKNEQIKNYIPVDTAKQIAFCAMKKGLALEIIRRSFSSIMNENSNKRTFLNKLIELKKIIPEIDKDCTFYSLRKEQLFLIQENERLLNQVNNLKTKNPHIESDWLLDELSKSSERISDPIERQAILKSENFNIKTRISCLFLSSVLKNYLMYPFIKLMMIKNTCVGSNYCSLSPELRNQQLDFCFKVITKIIWAKNFKLKMQGFYAFIKNTETQKFKDTINNQKSEKTTNLFPEENFSAANAKFGEFYHSKNPKMYLKNRYENENHTYLYKDGNYLNNLVPQIFIPDYYTNLPSFKSVKRGTMYIPVNNSKQINNLLKSANREFDFNQSNQFPFKSLENDITDLNQVNESQQTKLDRMLIKKITENDLAMVQEKLIETLTNRPDQEDLTYPYKE